MKRITCPSCGLVNFANESRCRRCNLRLGEFAAAAQDGGARREGTGGGKKRGGPRPGTFVVGFIAFIAVFGSLSMHFRWFSSPEPPAEVEEGQEAEASPTPRAKASPPGLSGSSAGDRSGGARQWSPDDFWESVQENSEAMSERTAEHQRRQQESLEQLREELDEKNREVQRQRDRNWEAEQRYRQSLIPPNQ